MELIVECECGQRYGTPEHNAGRRTRCPECGRELTVPTPEPADDVLYIADVPEPSRTSRAAVVSVCLGALFFAGCFSGVPAILIGCLALGDINRSGGQLRGRRSAIAGIVLGVIGCLFTIVLLMPTREDWPAARRAQCVNNLKQIGLALHNYHAVYGCLPPAAITDKNGRPLLSWRVAILPFVDTDARHMNFHLDEPWDSPHNLALLNAMPSVYQCPSDQDHQPGTTNYQVIIGPNTDFPPDFRPVTFADVTDGTSTTIAVGESRRSVPWTKPDDVSFELAASSIGLGSDHDRNGFNVLLTDGSVRFLRRAVPAPTLRAFLTRNGNDALAEDPY